MVERKRAPDLARDIKSAGLKTLTDTRRHTLTNNNLGTTLTSKTEDRNPRDLILSQRFYMANRSRKHKNGNIRSPSNMLGDLDRPEIRDPDQNQNRIR